MEFKIGDTVRVKSLEWYNEQSRNGATSFTIGDKECEFEPQMAKYCGKEFVVEDTESNPKGYEYVVYEGWAFTRDFLEPVSALRYNTGKPKWSLVHMHSLVPMIRVLEYGALKYAPFNWQKPMKRDEVLDSMQRHLAALIDGKELDDESGLNHIGHIMANAMFYSYHFVK
jgi:hypothetical protein